MARKTRKSQSARALMESLEDRRHLSITWTNRGDDSDNFDDVFGADADVARGVIDSAIAEWNRVVTGYQGEEFDVDLTVSMNPGNEGTSGAGGASERTDDGVPVAGNITINTAGPIGQSNWYLDPTPDDHSEFRDNLVHAFAGDPTPGGPVFNDDAMMTQKRDLRTLVVHEIGHVMGIAGGVDLIYDNPDIVMYDTDQPDTETSEPEDEYWIFDGPSVTALMTTYDILAGSSDEAGHNAMRRDDNTPFTWDGFEVFSAIDTMQPTGLSVHRVLLSKKVSLMLEDMGYDVTPPETFGTFHAMVDGSGMLTIQGGNDDTEIDNVDQGPSADDISVTRVGNELVVSVDVGVDVPGTGSGQTVNDQQPAFVSRFNVADVEGIRIYGFGGNDTVTLSGDLGFINDEIEAYGGAGNDVMSATGVANEPVAFRGEGGSDTLTGTSSADDLRGGDGNDNLSGGSGSDDVFGDAGNDILNGGLGNDDLVGGAGNDTASGGTGNDYLLGGDGNDLLIGQGGSDTCYGNQGGDTIIGGSILASLHGRTPVPADGADVLAGYEDDDVLHGDNVYHGTSVPVGGGGNDLMRGGDGNDVLFGNLGDDNVHGDAGDDAVHGMAGADRLYGEEGNDVLRGGTEDDLLYGLDGDDELFGEDGADRLTGGRGSDQLIGGNDDDQLIGGVAFTGAQDTSADTLAGDAGNDELHGDNYGIGGAPQGGDDAILGGAGNDYVRAGPGADRVEGSDGDDDLHGDGGNDLVRGGTGDDALFGDDGNDILLGETGADDATGGNGRDVLIGGINADVFHGSAGDDLLIAGTTAFDADDASLFAVRAEWTSRRDYQDRVKNLRGTNGPAFDQRLNGDIFLVAPGNNSTVFFDGEINTLNGEADDDWFFRFPPDVTDAVGGESIN